MSGTPWQEIAQIALTDHEINLFFRFRGIGVDTPAISFDEFATAAKDMLPPDQPMPLIRRHTGQKLWSESTCEIGDDLYPYVKELLSGQRPDLGRCSQLTDLSKRLLDKANIYDEDAPKEVRTQKYLALALGKRAGERLSQLGLSADPIRFSIDNVMLHQFWTGTCLAQVSLSLHPAPHTHLSPIHLLEAQVALARFSNVQWCDEKTGTALKSGFELKELIAQLVIGNGQGHISHERALSYSYVQLNDNITTDAAKRLVMHMSRHYTSDYVMDLSGDMANQALSPFDTVRHAVAREGASTLVMPAAKGDHLPEFLKTFKQATFHKHYLPIAILAMHERHFLIDRTSRSLVRPDDACNPVKTMNTFRCLRSDSLTFRVCYRFSEVSHISMHNELNLAMRRAFNLDRMLADLASDVSEIEHFLRATEAEARAQKYHWASVIGGASLAALTAVTISKEVSFAYYAVNKERMNSPLAKTMAITNPPAPLSKDNVWEFHAPYALVFALLIGAVAIAMIWSRGPETGKKVRGHNMTLHALLEHMLKAANR